MAEMQSQQPCSILQHSASPLVQVIHTPLGVLSHLHIPIVKLQQQHTRPFIKQQHEHMPPASIEQRFCTMLHAVASSQTQFSLSPSLHFSTLSVQRGTIM
jgi:hypothetical protein